MRGKRKYILKYCFKYLYGSNHPNNILYSKKNLNIKYNMITSLPTTFINKEFIDKGLIIKMDNSKCKKEKITNVKFKNNIRIKRNNYKTKLIGGKL
jgi:hypothetical protein